MMRAGAASQQLDKGTSKGQWHKVYEANFAQILIGPTAIRNARSSLAINAKSRSNRSKISTFGAVFARRQSHITSHGARLTNH
jgi:hypothetical protein